MKSFLFVMQSAGHSSAKVVEVLDEVLIAAAFDQHVSLLLLDDAVFHLKKNQQSIPALNKDIGAIYQSLKLYDIENIFVEQESLAQRGLSQADLLLSTTLLSRRDVASTLNSFDLILNG